LARGSARTSPVTAIDVSSVSLIEPGSRLLRQCVLQDGLLIPVPSRITAERTPSRGPNGGTSRDGGVLSGVVLS